MTEMKSVVEALKASGLRDKLTIMVGGAPVTDSFCKSIGADLYSPDAASAADAAVTVVDSVAKSA
jgi:methanogenic corrinoid protein MtbC1